jgi:ubiquitin C-terminal hydrolase
VQCEMRTNPFHCHASLKIRCVCCFRKRRRFFHIHFTRSFSREALEIPDCVRDVLAPDAVTAEANRVAAAREKTVIAEVENHQSTPTPFGLGSTRKSLSFPQPTSTTCNGTNLAFPATNEAGHIKRPRLRFKQPEVALTEGLLLATTIAAAVQLKSISKQKEKDNDEHDDKKRRIHMDAQPADVAHDTPKELCVDAQESQLEEGDSNQCGICFSYGIDAVANESKCIDTQRDRGCHTCGQKHCWATSRFCGHGGIGNDPCGLCLSFGQTANEGTACCLQTQFDFGCHLCDLRGCCNISCPTLRLPRPLYNAMRISGGGGSCFMNAALQALFAPDSIKKCLLHIWRNLDEDRQRQLSQGDASNAQKYEALFAFVYTQATNTEFSPFYSSLLNNLFYKGEQGDSDEFMRVLIEGTFVAVGSPAIAAIMRGYTETILKCTNNEGRCCGTSAPKKEGFTWFDLEMQTECRSFQSVQEAIDAISIEEAVDGVEKTCPVCNRGSATHKQTWRKQTYVVKHPQVLVLVFKRFGPRGHMHAVEATENITFFGKNYYLRSFVCHLGPSIHAGHYVAFAKHGTRDAPKHWYLYDDDKRVVVSPCEISKLTASYEHWGVMQSYIFLYEEVL